MQEKIDSAKMGTEKPALLRMEGIDKVFPGVKALNNVSLTE